VHCQHPPITLPACGCTWGRILLAAQKLPDPKECKERTARRPVLVLHERWRPLHSTNQRHPLLAAHEKVHGPLAICSKKPIKFLWLLSPQRTFQLQSHQSQHTVWLASNEPQHPTQLESQHPTQLPTQLETYESTDELLEFRKHTVLQLMAFSDVGTSTAAAGIPKPAKASRVERADSKAEAVSDSDGVEEISHSSRMEIEVPTAFSITARLQEPSKASHMGRTSSTRLQESTEAPRVERAVSEISNSIGVETVSSTDPISHYLGVEGD
jgi:hypothetical protein